MKIIDKQCNENEDESKKLEKKMSVETWNKRSRGSLNCEQKNLMRVISCFVILFMNDKGDEFEIYNK